MPSDFIASAHSDYPLPGHQAPLMANFLAQSAVLAFGKTEAEARAELQAAGVPARLIGGAFEAAELDAKRAIDQACRLAAEV